MVADFGRILTGMANRAVDAAETASSAVDRYYYRPATGNLREIARNSAVVDSDCAGAINTARGRGLQSHTDRGSDGLRAGISGQQPADATSFIPTSEIVPATT
ncbi:hypothetical protein OG874_39460 [Nocardia sp. NBC_00565]|uniref:hypothetical protein n=1 Tax=Nocardia sp. NBC_00565 TaxID=2975993 RepID=UPI002E81F70F|nr:hypothetical protein [Nocardia sp. NBC_00565]WUC02716.1 hypothetical protein OG874_39460 [Nocardia sp. NBC_00565]